MRSEDLQNLVEEIIRQKTERQTLELKAAHGGFPGKIYDTISAFANQNEGGILVFGIEEAPVYKVVGVYDAADVQKKVMESCKQMTPTVRAVLTMAEVDGKMIVAAEIPGMPVQDRPVFYTAAGRLTGSYVRVGNADERMTEAEIYSYEAFKEHIRDDMRLIAGANLKYINQQRLAQYLQAVRQDRNRFLQNMSEEESLELMGICSNNLPTLAGIMVFALYPQAFLPQLCITAVSVEGTKLGDIGENGERFIDNERITGAIPDMLEAALDFVRRNSRNSTVVTADGKRADVSEYPVLAVREAILNALVHRDYSIHTENIPISIELYRDRLEVKSSGGLYGGIVASDLGKVRPYTRNPALANILELLHVTENRYSGIPTIRNELQKAGMKAPEFMVKRGEFITVFRNKMGNIGLENEIKISQAGNFEPDSMEGRQLRVSEFCKQPKSKREICEFLRVSEAYATKKIIKAMMDDGRLKMTLPDKPNSRNQKYVSEGL